MNILFCLKREGFFVLRSFLSILHLRLARPPKIETFDIFDTCLSRNYSFPDDLFIDLARELIKHQPAELKEYSIDSLSLARKYAQKIAYSCEDSKDPTLESIYLEMAKIIPGLDISRGAKIEKDLEAKSYVPCAYTMKLVEAARRKHGYVVFISDMYLPKDFLSEQLSVHGFFKDGDKLYVSSEQKGNKITGTLFREVAKSENLQLREILHSGDNSDSDILQPFLLNMQSRNIFQARLTTDELQMHKTISAFSNYAASRFVGALRSGRISRISSKTTIDDLVASFTAPFLWTFGEWILNNCKKDNIDNIFLSSRDCLGLYWVLSDLIKIKGYSINLNYFQVSRSSLVKASLYKEGKLNLHCLRKTFNGKRLSKILSFLDVCPTIYQQNAEAFEDHCPDIDDLMTSECDWKKFEICLQNCSAYQDLLSRAKEEKEAAINYFSFIGLTDSSNKFVVDLFVNLYNSEMLQCLVDDISGSGDIKSLFLGVGNSVRISSKNIRFKSVFDSNFDFSGRFNLFFSRPALFEMLLSCDGSTPLASYKDVYLRNCPLKNDPQALELNFRKNCGTSLWRYSKKHIASLYEGENSLRFLMLILAENFVLFPDKKWLSLFKNLNEFDDTFLITKIAFASPLCITTAKIRLLAREIRESRPLPILGNRRWRELALVNTSLILYVLSFPVYLTTNLLQRLLINRPKLKNYQLQKMALDRYPISYKIYVKFKQVTAEFFGRFGKDLRVIIRNRYLK